MRPEMLRTVWTLHRQGMPLSEIGVVIASDDPVVVRRYLELHGERLEERLADERRELASIERLIAARAPVAQWQLPLPSSTKFSWPSAGTYRQS